MVVRALLAVLILSGCGGIYPDPNAIEPAVAVDSRAYRAAIRERTVLLAQHCGGALKGWGTAVLLEAQRGVTAGHVVELGEGCGLLATDMSGNLSGVVVVSVDEDRDQAIIELPQLPASALRTKVREPEWGERIACAGFSFQPIKPRTQMLSMTHGTVATTPAEGMPDGYFRTTAPALPGHSGGGCWGSDGALLLIVQAGHFQFEGYIYGRPVR